MKPRDLNPTVRMNRADSTWAAVLRDEEPLEGPVTMWACDHAHATRGGAQRCAWLQAGEAVPA